MKTKLLLLGLFLATGIRAGCGEDGGAAVPDGVWHPVSRSEFLAVAVERALYERDGSERFFVKIKVTNRSSVTVQVDLRDYWRVIHPNQWGVLKTDEREVVNESRMEIVAPDEAKIAEVLEAGRNGLLTAIPAGGSVAYFRDFNASGRKEVEKQEGELPGAKNVFVSMDGELLATDGRKVDQASCSWDLEGVSTDVVIPVPTTWKRVDPGARVLEDR